MNPWRSVWVVAVSLFYGLSFASAASPSSACAINENLGCSTDSGLKLNSAPSGTQASQAVAPVGVEAPAVTIDLFYAYDCPHCHEAMEWLPELEEKFPNVAVRKFEIKKNPENRKLFEETAQRFKVQPSGVPTFFVGDKVLVGFYKGQTCKALIDEVRTLTFREKPADCASKEINVPFLGTLQTGQISLLQFSLIIGLLDGLNPCAMWVLMFLLGMLAYSKSKKQVFLVGGIFVMVSGLIYFAFMSAWLNLFTLVGYGRTFTVMLALVAIGMGFVNLKELFFFKKGISLMIPDSAKPKIAEKARQILQGRGLLLTISTTIVLAVFVNFIELGCTIGLPAIFTKLLAERNLVSSSRYGYMAIYNLAYIVPLAVIVGFFGFTMSHAKLTERQGKVLKLISGILMLSLGLLMLFKPELLVFS